MSFSPRTPRRLRATRAAAVAALLALSACGGRAPEASTSPAIAVVDDAGDTLRLAAPARRIVSLAPNATETLVAIGALPQLVGRSDYDVGLGVDSVASVGGALDPSLERLVALRPDLVIGWHSAGANPVRDRLREMGIPFLAVRTTDTTDIYRTLGVLGRVTGRDASADSVTAAVRAQLAAVRASVAGRPPRTAFYVIGDEPLMTAGPGTFTVQLMEIAGGRTAFPDATGQPQYVSMEELVRRQPEVILLPVGADGAARVAELRTRPGWRELNAFRAGTVHALPADAVNRMGPGIGDTARRFRDALHPDLAGR
ncbi:MAG TPA: helical backbone metal receptor [Longimicrobium sp.]|uniref:ABC transporter substrate-binding protein n=1 Tax=Longimicrobium sp. TaxID=2029185 RepID=UPI002ED9B288